MTTHTLINGRPGDVIDVNDRGLQYGDGLFETMAVINGNVRRLDLHLERLQLGCTRLGIPCPPRELLIDELSSVCRTAADASDRAVLKLILTRGPAARGDDTHARVANIEPTRIITLSAWPDYHAHWSDDGVTIRWCTTTLPDEPPLAGIKHLNRLPHILARREWTDAKIAEGLLCDIHGRVICGTKTNLFLVRDNTLTTPRLDASGVAGTTRAAVLTRAHALGIPPTEEHLTPYDLTTADELFLTNALIGIWPVRQLGTREFRPGPITRQLQQLLC